MKQHDNKKRIMLIVFFAIITVLISTLSCIAFEKTKEANDTTPETKQAQVFDSIEDIALVQTNIKRANTNTTKPVKEFIPHQKDESDLLNESVTDDLTGYVDHITESQKESQGENEQDLNKEPENNKDEISTEDNNSSSNSGGTDSSNKDSVYAENYVGRFKLPAGNINVACYQGNSQAIVDAADSACYFYAAGHVIIGDHVNQGFSGIKSAQVGTKAYFETPTGTIEYTCLAKINGHNTGSVLTDSEGNSIKDLYPGALVCYTCNGNWQNVIIVFFGSPSAENEEIIESTYDCENEIHCWEEWEILLEKIDENGEYRGWETRICKLCGIKEMRQRKEPSENFQKPEDIPSEEDTSTDEEIDTTEPPELDNDIVEDDTSETTPPETETTPPESNDNIEEAESGSEISESEPPFEDGEEDQP